ncbi:hypothetical protein [Faecalibacterium prausnitzii]|uniref:hypothetical protein n=1 Tax=Faecalibacterium prausnitzii TaxID=853 RepID=UPI003C2FA76B
MNDSIPFHPQLALPQITVDVNILTMLKQAASCLTEMVSEICTLPPSARTWN